MTSSIISKDIATRFYKLALHTAELFSNECDCINRNGCIMITKDTFTILSTGVSTCVYSDPSKNINNKMEILYYVSAVEDAITSAVKLGGISLNDSIAIVTNFPDIYNLKLLIRSGITTIVTPLINNTNTTNNSTNTNYKLLIEPLDIIIIN